MNQTNRTVTLKPLTVIIVIGVAVFFYLSISNSFRLTQAIDIIKKVETDLKVVSDSLENAQKSIINMLQKLEFTENELQIVKAQRDILELEEMKRQTTNRSELQRFKEEIKTIETKRDSLIREAKKFEI
jgi:archaellum component FlaC